MSGWSGRPAPAPVSSRTSSWSGRRCQSRRARIRCRRRPRFPGRPRARRRRVRRRPPCERVRAALVRACGESRPPRRL